MTIATELTKLETNLDNAFTMLEDKGATISGNKNFDNLSTSIDSLIDLSAEGYNVTINNKAHQQISAQIEPMWKTTDYTSSFKAGPLNMAIKLHLYIHSTDAGYAHGALSWSPNTFVNGGLLTNNLTVNVTDATPIQDVVIPTGYEDYYLHNNASYFYEDTNYDNYVTRSGLSNKVIIFDLDNYLTGITNISSLFNGCSGITAIDLSNLNTSNITSMTSLFYDCSSLTSLNISNLNTGKTTSIAAMFQGCSSLTSLNLNHLNTSSVTSMASTFSGCTALTSLNINNWNTINVTVMGGMFRNCSSLTSLNISNFDTSNVTNMDSMFQNCSSLTTLNLSNFDTSKVTTMVYMFQNCSSLTTLNLSNFDTSKVTTMGYIFNGCNHLTRLVAPSFTISKNCSTYYLFVGCSALTSLDVSNWDTSNATNLTSIFGNCTSLTTLDISNWDTTNVTSMSSFIFGADNLKYLIIGSSTFKLQLKSAITLPSTCKILVPNALLSTFRNATNWSTHSSKFAAIENYTITRSNGQVTVTPK